MKVVTSLLDSALQLCSQKMYSHAKLCLYKIKDGPFYDQSRALIVKIDGMIQSRLLHEQADAANAENKRMESRLKQIKEEVLALYLALLSFKDKSDFHDYGFGVGGKYNQWLKDINRLKVVPEALTILAEDGFAIGDVSTLGMEYMMTKGQDNDYTRWANKRIRDGLDLD